MTTSDELIDLSPAGQAVDIMLDGAAAIMRQLPPDLWAVFALEAVTAMSAVCAAVVVATLDEAPISSVDPSSMTGRQILWGAMCAMRISAAGGSLEDIRQTVDADVDALISRGFPLLSQEG